MKRLYLFVWILILAVSPTVQASIIFNNGLPNSSSILGSDRDIPFELADDFLLSSGSNIIRDVHWWGAYYYDDSPPEDDHFVIRIYEEVSTGTPSLSPLFERTVGNPNRTFWGRDDVLGYDHFSYGTSISPITLIPDKVYWLSITNDTTNDTNDHWGWIPVSNVGNSLGRYGDDLDWFAAGTQFHMAFYLTDDVAQVPEPTTMLLLGLGLLGIAGIRKRLKR